MSTRTKAVNASRGVSVRGRDAGQPSAPIRVSDEARSKNTSAVRSQRSGLPGRDRNVLAERPNTAGGQSPHFSARRDAESRRAKDDLHLHPLPTHARVMNSPSPTTLAGALPTPAGTPESSPPLLQKSPLKGTDTPDSMTDGRLAPTSAEEAGIGMALGSPSQIPAAWQSPPPMDYTARSLSPDDPEPSHAQVPARQKSRKWKLLGGLFGGKKQSPALEPQPFYQLQPEPVNHAMGSPDYAPFAEPTLHSDRRPSNAVAGSRGRAYSERHSSKNKPDMRRANTVPMNFDSQDPDRERMRAPQITLEGGRMNHESQHGGLMLNVDIPSVEMERYSVMFGSVLQKPTGASSSSLLARRQATLERLKSVAEAMPKHEHDHRGNQRHPMPRRASSPQPAKSPAFSLFPNAPARLYATPGPPSPPPALHAPHHRRSNTSPAVPSPSFPSFPRTEQENHGALLAPAPQHVAPSPRLKDHISSQMRVPAKEVKKTPSNLSVRQQKSELPTTPAKPHQASHPTTEKIEDVRSHEQLQTKPKPVEPARPIITSPREHAASRSVSGPQSSVTSLTRGYSVSITASGVTSTTTRSSSTRHNSPMQSPPSSLFRNLTTTSAPVRATTPVSAPARAEPSGRSKEEDEEEREKKLRTAADISIARQISVSREQTRLIIPMRSPSSKRANSPNALTIGQVASPLGVVAAGGEHSPAGRASSRKDETKKPTKERLAAPAAKPNTPTLVVVGDAAEEGWEGATASNAGGEEGKPRGVAEHRYRKSERVVFENID